MVLLTNHVHDSSSDAVFSVEMRLLIDGRSAGRFSELVQSRVNGAKGKE